MGNREILCGLGLGEAIVFDGPEFDSAIIGTTDDGRVVYSFDRMAASLAESDGMSWEDAVDFICYNTLRALPYLGDKAPVVVMNEGEFAGDGD